MIAYVEREGELRKGGDDEYFRAYIYGDTARR